MRKTPRRRSSGGARTTPSLDLEGESVYVRAGHGRYCPREGRVLKMLMVSRQVQVMSTLPLKAVSRLWGRFNDLDIPYYLRVPGFRLYSWIFGVK